MEIYSDNEADNDHEMLDSAAQDEELSEDGEGDSMHSEAEEVPVPGTSTAGKEEEESKKKVKPKKTVKNPQPKLNLDALKGPRGLLTLNKLFKEFKFKGNGHEKQDLEGIMKLTEQWAYRLYPKYHFEDSLQRLESLGTKKTMQSYLTKIRLGIADDEDVVKQFDADGDVIENDPPVEPVQAMDDQFDQLLSQQIQTLQKDTGTAQKFDQLLSQQIQTLQKDTGTAQKFDQLLSQQIQTLQKEDRPTVTAEQIERMERNRRMAMEKRRARAEEEAAKESTAQNSQDSAVIDADMTDV